MFKIFLIALLFICSITFAQQESAIKLDSASKNQISVEQNDDSIAKKSNIVLVHADSNKVNVSQSNNHKPLGKQSVFWKFMGNTYTIVGILASLATIVGLIWMKRKSGTK
jgi:hypothetical protein